MSSKHERGVDWLVKYDARVGATRFFSWSTLSLVSLETHQYMHARVWEYVHAR